MIRAVIADDEVLARQKLRVLLRDETDIEIVGECATARETLELVQATYPDLLFLDVRMPDMDGFETLGMLSRGKAQTAPQVVFTTAYDQYAVRAFDIHAIDYLLKPFTGERLKSALDKVRDRMRHFDRGEPENSTNEGAYAARIVFKSRGRILFLPVEEIRWITAEENYVRICVGPESHLLRETMVHLEARLDPEIFLRVHRSSIVNLRFVKEVASDSDGEATVILIGGDRIAMSRGYKSRIQKMLRR